MSLSNCSILFTLLVGLWVSAAAQTDQQPATPTQAQNPQSSANDSGSRSVPAGAASGLLGANEDSEEPVNNLPAIPAVIGGRGVSTPNMERSNYLRGGLNVGAAYSDNALLVPGSQVGNATYSVYPNIAIEQTTSRTRLSLGYGAGLTVNQRLSSQNQQAHSLNFDSEFRLSPHVNLRAAEDFSLVAGIFGANVGAGFSPGQGGGNSTLITPVANTRTSNTVVEADYHYALNDIVGASGSLHDLHFSQVTTGTGSLTNTRSGGGSVFWMHQLFRGNWAGFGYGFRRITYDPNGETKIHRFSLIDSLRISRTVRITGFIGPEYTENDGVAATGPEAGQLTSFTAWRVSGGIDAGWQTLRDSVSGGYSRQVNDGAGLLGAVRLDSVHALVGHEFTPGWTVNLSATYGNNESLTLATTTTATSIKTVSVGAMIVRDVRRNFGFQLGYFHDFQDQSGSLTPAQNYNLDRNRVFISLSYQWAKPLGR